MTCVFPGATANDWTVEDGIGKRVFDQSTGPVLVGLLLGIVEPMEGRVRVGKGVPAEHQRALCVGRRARLQPVSAAAVVAHDGARLVFAR